MKDTMRIGVNCFLLTAEIGGIKQYFFSLFRELLARSDGNKYVFFYFEQNLSALTELDYALWKKDGILLTSQKEIYNHLDKIDIFFCPFGSLSPRPLPIPTVVTLVDIQEVFFPEFFTTHNLLARQYHYQGSTSLADRVVTISDFSKRTIVKHHRLKMNKVKVAHLCADPRFYKAEEIGRRPDCKLPEKFVFYPANHWLHKNHDILLRALVWMKEEKGYLVNAVFTGFDQGSGYQIGKKAKEYGLSEQVFQLGYISVEELAYLYTKAQLLVFPSLFEGFGIPLVEAMAAGCPVLAANTTSLPEVGQESVAYFDPSSAGDLGESIVELLEDEQQYNALRSKGRLRARDFSAAKLADDHLHVFKDARDSFSWSRYLVNRWWWKYLDIVKFLLRIFFINLKQKWKSFGFIPKKA